MLETEEVDDDFFTPISGTSLANIFGNAPNNKSQDESDSLKYIPPKPQSMVPKENDPIKSTECVFASALIGHEWCNNVYTSRGKIGFAIVKIQKTGIHNIILYDSNKTTLSSTFISKSLTVFVRNNSYVSYYDNLQKYWSIYGTVEEITKICGILQSLGVKLNYASFGTDKGPPEPNKAETKENIDDQEKAQHSRESDTDSSVNRKTKASILNRMANMGHSVLPTRKKVTESSSESSGANETVVQPKVVKHKPSKTFKKNTVETVLTEPHQIPDAHQLISKKTESENILSVKHNQILPISSIFTSNSNDMAMFMSEQRINNSELRININRIHDKIDAVVNKMHNLENKDVDVNISTDILLKLLAEYENKIKTYEELLRSKGIDNNKLDESMLTNKNKNIDLLTSKLSDLQNEREDNLLKISKLENEIQLLKDGHSHKLQEQSTKETELNHQINKLENDLRLKNKEITKLSDNNALESKKGTDKIQNKVKNIMNDAFQSITMNFENNETYTGDSIKRIVGTVIKKITIEALNEL